VLLRVLRPSFSCSPLVPFSTDRKFFDTPRYSPPPSCRGGWWQEGCPLPAVCSAGDASSAWMSLPLRSGADPHFGSLPTSNCYSSSTFFPSRKNYRSLPLAISSVGLTGSDSVREHCLFPFTSPLTNVGFWLPSIYVYIRRSVQLLFSSDYRNAVYPPGKAPAFLEVLSS